MADLFTQQGSGPASERLTAKPLDEARWQAWMAKGRAHDVRVRGRAISAVKWVLIAALIAFAALWSQLARHEVILTSVILLGGVLVTGHATSQREV